MFFISVDSKGVQVVCFDTLLQVLILNELRGMLLPSGETNALKSRALYELNYTKEITKSQGKSW
jgi:hypothetical protein